MGVIRTNPIHFKDAEEYIRSTKNPTPIGFLAFLQKLRCKPLQGLQKSEMDAFEAAMEDYGCCCNCCSCSGDKMWDTHCGNKTKGCYEAKGTMV